ncbi:MAG: hypothetical protein ACFE95_00640 [Candidatus Hodarchaeota archaeon]
MKVYLIPYGVNPNKFVQFKQKLDSISGYEGIYDKGEEELNDSKSIRNYLQNLMSPCGIVALLLGIDRNKSRYIEDELRIGLGKKRAIFRIEGKHPGSLKSLPGRWYFGVSINKGDKNTVKRALDWLNWPYFSIS